MIATVTLNAAIDKTYHIANFSKESTNRVTKMYAMPGGKGINVTRVIHTLGYPVLASGFTGGKNGEYIENELTKLNITHDFLRLHEESRICLNVIEAPSRSFEILEPGPTITQEDYLLFKRKISSLAQKNLLIAFSGSLPQGLAPETYCELVELAQSNGATAFLDTSGLALRHGIQASPFLIKPNEEELAELLGITITNEQQLISAIYDLMNRGVSCVVVTLGSKGALAGYQGRVIESKYLRYKS
jgi:tagatose 6-phosphate kinase